MRQLFALGFRPVIPPAIRSQGFDNENFWKKGDARFNPLIGLSIGERVAIVRLHPAQYHRLPTTTTTTKKLELKSGKWGMPARTSVRTKGKGEKRLVFPIGTSELISLDGLAVFPKDCGFSAPRTVFEPGLYRVYNFEKFGARGGRTRFVSIPLQWNNRRKKGGNDLAGISNEILRFRDIVGANYSV